MNQELITETRSDWLEACPSAPAASEESIPQEHEPLFFTIPSPPVPGTTSWSLAPL